MLPRFIRVSAAVFMAVVLAAVVSVAAVSADHKDVITERIPVGSTAVTLEPIADGFGTPVWGTTAPYETNHLYVADQFGGITVLTLDGSAEPRSFLDVGPAGADLLVTLKTEGFDERGLLGLAFHPHYRKNGLFYTYTSEPLGPVPDFTTLDASAPREADGSLSVVREWRVDEPRRHDAAVDPGASRVLLRIEQPRPNHNAGALAFGPDAMLYIALGDGGSRDDEGVGHAPGGNGQSLDDGNVLGKILRIDPLGSSSDNGAYGIPADNPFAAAAGADEIFAYGFRNPFRMSFDHGTGQLYAADVGQRDIEEVDIVVAGGNYGWPVKEGTFLFDGKGPNIRGSSADDSPGVPADMIDPVAQYDHDEGISITGGFVYRGQAIPELEGSYVFGDLTRDADRVEGRFFELTAAGELREFIPSNNDDNRLLITGFGRDTQGELYVMGLQPTGTNAPAGVVYKLAPT